MERRAQLAFLGALVALLAVVDCRTRAVPTFVMPDASVKSADGGRDGGHRVGLLPNQPSLPCSDAGLATDPNNCGACGTLCGTFGPNAQGGASFMQGTCVSNVCFPYTESTAALDCWDSTPAGSIIGGTVTFQQLCVSVLSSPQNCGGLGWVCGGACLQGRCAGQLKVPPPLTIAAASPATSPQTITASGGTPPYQFSFAPNGNASGSTISAAGYYVPNHAIDASAVTDVVLVTDSVGATNIVLIIVNLG